MARGRAGCHQSAELCPTLGLTHQGGLRPAVTNGWREIGGIGGISGVRFGSELIGLGCHDQRHERLETIAACDERIRESVEEGRVAWWVRFTEVVNGVDDASAVEMEPDTIGEVTARIGDCRRLTNRPVIGAGVSASPRVGAGTVGGLGAAGEPVRGWGTPGLPVR